MKSGPRSVHPPRVLLVDDEPTILEALTTAFEMAGVEVVGCRSFEEARLKLLMEKFDVIMTDVRLGAYNGIQLAVIARDKHPDIDIVVFSGYDDPVLREEAEHVGAVYRVKPITAGELLELIPAL